MKDVNQRFKVRFIMDNVDEQIDTVSRSVLGLTASCARCHDHKFDPIPTTDYYALAGIFPQHRPVRRSAQQDGGGGLDYYDTAMLSARSASSRSMRETTAKLEKADEGVAVGAERVPGTLRQDPKETVMEPDGRPKRAIARQKMTSAPVADLSRSPTRRSSGQVGAGRARCESRSPTPRFVFAARPRSSARSCRAAFWASCSGPS